MAIEIILYIFSTEWGLVFLKNTAREVTMLVTILSPYMVKSLFIFAFLLLSISLYFKHKNWREGWLSTLIEEERKKTEKREKQERDFLKMLKVSDSWLIKIENRFRLDRIKQDVEQFYLPSLSSLGIILVLFTIIFYFGHRDIPYKSFLEINTWKQANKALVEKESLTNAIAILTGLAAVVFALVIFVAESIRDNKSYEQKRVLLKVSNLWLLITLTTLSLLNFLWFKATVLSLVLPFSVAVLVIVSLWNVISMLLDVDKQKKSQVKFLKERIERSMYESIRERIGNTILLNKVGKDKEIKIDYTLSKRWIANSIEDYFYIESDKDGWLADINFRKLRELTGLLEESAQRLGFSIYTETLPSSGRSEASGTHRSQEGSMPVKTVFLLKRYGEYLSASDRESRLILALPKEFQQDNKLVRHVRSEIDSIFLFRKGEPVSATFRKELQGTKEQLVAAIKSTSVASVEELKQVYIDIAETFLTILTRFGGGYSVEQAKTESGNIIEGWNEVRWLNEDIHELMSVAIETRNKNVITEIIYLPIAIASRALDAKDHLLFQDFTRFSQSIYYLTEDMEDSKLKSFIKERSWRYLTEFVKYRIESELTDDDNYENTEDVKEFGNFGLDVFRVFQNLIKLTFDREDIETFQKVLSEFQKLFDRFKPTEEHPDLDYLNHSLSWSQSEEEKEKIRKKIEFRETQISISNRLTLSKEEIIFGTTAYLLERYRLSQWRSLFQQFFDEANAAVPSDLVRLTEVYIASRSLWRDNFWGWDDWDMIPDGVVRSIDVESKLDRLYCVKALQILGGKTPEVIATIELPKTRDLAYLSEDRQRTLFSVLEDLSSHSSEWNSILTLEQLAKIPALKELLKSAKEAQEEIEEEAKKNAPIDEEKLKEFKKEVFEEFDKTGHLRKIAVKLGVYDDLTHEKPTEPVSSYGYNQIHDKGPLIKEWHIISLGLGEEFGRGLGRSEDEVVFGEIAEGITENKNIQKNEVISEIETILLEKNLEYPVVLQTLNHNFEYEQVRQSERFISHYSKDCPPTIFDGLGGYMGVLKIADINVPVIDIFVWKEDLKNKVVVTDVGKLGRWKQYLPIEKSEDAPYQEDIFLFRVADLNTEDGLRQEILKENPTWLQQEENPEDYLQKRMLIRIFEKMTFKVEQPSLGACLTVSDIPVEETED